MKWNTEINLDNHKVFFTADLHLYHNNILWMNNRPFKTCDEMWESIKYDWNSKVGKDDYIFVLGDVLWGSNASRLKSMADSLNGRICIVLGNHDQEKIANGKSGSNFDCFYSYSRADFIRCRSKLTDTNIQIYMSHYPTLSWPQKGRGAIMLHGHCHGNIDEYNDQSPDLRVDVGLDGKLAKMRILSLDEVYEYMLHKAGDISLSDYMMKLYLQNKTKEAIL